MRVDDFLSTWWYVIINKKLLKAMWINKACFLMELVSQRRRFEKKTKTKSFFITQKNIFDYIWINKRTQIRYLKEFEDLWVIGVEKRGMPQRNWYTINDDVIINIINKTWEIEDEDDELTILDMDDTEMEDEIEEVKEEKTRTKGKEEDDNLFEEFREKYPRKVNKKKAETSFKKLSEEDKRLAIDMIEKFKQTKQWQDKQYIPHPTTYLNWLRFKDEVDECDIAWYVDESKTEEIEKDEKIEEKFMQLWNEYPQNRRTNEFEARQIFYSMTEEEQNKSISMLKIYKMSENWSKNDWQYIIWICRYLKEKIYNVDPDEDKYHFSDPNSRWIRNSRWYIEEKYYLCH